VALTPITAGIPWNDVGLLQELVGGLAKRAAAAGLGAWYSDVRHEWTEGFETESWWPRRYPTDGLTVTGVYGVEQADEPSTEEDAEYWDKTGTVHVNGVIVFPDFGAENTFIGQVIRCDEYLKPGTTIKYTNCRDWIEVGSASVLQEGTVTIRFYPAGAANGTAGPYYIIVKEPPIQPGSLTVTAGGQTLTDDGAGRLEQDGVKRGRVSYRRGVVVAFFDDLVSDDTAITLDYTTDVTALTVDVVPGFTAAMVGCWLSIEDVGSGKVLAVKELMEEEENGYAVAWVAGDLECEAVTYAVAPNVEVQPALFWNRLYEVLLRVVPLFVDHTRPKGEGGQPNDPGNYEKLATIPMLDVDTWLEVMEAHEDGLRFVPNLRVDSVYDPDAGTTELTQTDPAEGWFVEEMAGHKIEVAGLGEFEIVECDGMSATVTGNAAAAGRPACVLPLDWEDVADPAYGHRKESPIVDAPDEYGNGGHVIGPWMLADLQAGMLALQKTLGNVVFSAGGENNQKYGEGSDNFEGGTVEERQARARANATASFNSAEPPGWIRSEDGSPYAYSSCGWSWWYEIYWATLNRGYSYFSWSVSPMLAETPRDIDFYAKAWKVGELDFNGDGWPGWCTGEESPPQYARLLQESGVEGASGLSDQVGDIASAPAFATTWVERGYYGGTPAAVMTWAFED